MVPLLRRLGPKPKFQRQLFAPELFQSSLAQLTNYRIGSIKVSIMKKMYQIFESVYNRRGLHFTGKRNWPVFKKRKTDNIDIRNSVYAPEAECWQIISQKPENKGNFCDF